MTAPPSPSVYFVIPGRLDTPTGGFVYDRKMIAGLRAADRCAGVVVLPGSFPCPSPAAVTAASALLNAIPDQAWMIVDGLALTPLAPLFEAAAARMNMIALIHHPLCDETGLTAAEAVALFERERRALSIVRGIIVTSETTRRRLADFHIPACRTIVVRPGAVDRPAAPRRQQPDNGSAELLSVCSLIPRKGQDLLLDALAPLRHQRWQLTLVGAARDPGFARRLRLRARALRLSRRVAFTGELSSRQLRCRYHAADLFVLASRHEGFGIVLGEALAHGLPVVATRAGAIPEAVPMQAATLVSPRNKAALSGALRRLVHHRTARLRAAAVARRFARHCRHWQTAAGEFQIALDRIIAE